MTFSGFQGKVTFNAAQRCKMKLRKQTLLGSHSVANGDTCAVSKEALLVPDVGS